jgi:hypothetical protein
MTGKAGWLLFGIGILHLLLGIALARDLGGLISSGQIVNAVEPERSARVTLEFWFAIFAIPLMLLGHAYAGSRRLQTVLCLQCSVGNSWGSGRSSRSWIPISASGSLLL